MLVLRNVLEFQTKCKSKSEKDFEWTYRQGSTYHSTGHPFILVNVWCRCRRYGPWILVYWRATILYLWKTIFCRNRWFFIKIKKMVTSSFLSKMHASSICMKVNDLNWLQLCWWRVSETFYVGGCFFTWKKLPTSQRDGRSMITPHFIFFALRTVCYEL